MKKTPSVLRRAIVTAFAFAVLAVLLLAPLPESVRTIRGTILDGTGRKALAGLVFALILWIGEALPFHISGILAMLVLGFLGVQTWPELVRSGMGDEAVIFFIAVLLLAAAIARTGLAARLITPFLKLSRGSTRGAVFAIMAAGAFLATWLTALAAAALVLPSAKALLDAEGEKPGESKFGTALAMAVAWGPLIGACASPAGSGSNPVVIRFLSELAGYEVSFIRWMSIGVPLALILLPAGWLVLITLFPPERKRLRSVANADDPIPPKTPLSRDERAVAITFGLVAFLWLASPAITALTGVKLSVSLVACLGAVALFFPGVTSLSWKDLERSMDWAGIILIGAGIALGQALYKSGAAAWVSVATLGGIGNLSPFLQLLAVAAGVLVVKVVFSSNTLTGTVIVPLIIALGSTLGIDSTPLAFAGGIVANFAVILVTTSPVNILPWSTGFFTLKDMAKAGVVFAPFIALAVATVFTVLGPLAGF